jgi:hypothetical protein
MKLSIRIIELENECIANCPELEINCYGSDRDDAVRRIRNVLQFYISSAQELGFDVEEFDAMILEGSVHLPHTKHGIVDAPSSIH